MQSCIAVIFNNTFDRIILDENISMEDFAKVDLRIGKIVAAEPVPKAKKLLKLEVDMGARRSVVAGIAGSYATADLIGKQVVVVANLKPAKLMGVLSNGMVLAAVDKKKCNVATVDGEVAPGTKLT
jgi:methionyl-tRNA synthetase